MISIYVAGASRKWERARAFIERIHGHDGMRCAHDWTIGVQAAADEGVHDNSLDDEERIGFALDDLEAVRRCDVFVLLAEATLAGRGAWVELGYTIALVELRCEQGGDAKPPTTIVSGGDKRSIFTVPTLVDHEFAYAVGAHDDEAFAVLEELANMHAREPADLGTYPDDLDDRGEPRTSGRVVPPPADGSQS